MSLCEFVRLVNWPQSRCLVDMCRCIGTYDPCLLKYCSSQPPFDLHSRDGTCDYLCGRLQKQQTARKESLLRIDSLSPARRTLQSPLRDSRSFSRVYSPINSRYSLADHNDYLSPLRTLKSAHHGRLVSPLVERKGFERLESPISARKLSPTNTRHLSPCRASLLRMSSPCRGAYQG